MLEYETLFERWEFVGKHHEAAGKLGRWVQPPCAISTKDEIIFSTTILYPYLTINELFHAQAVILWCSSLGCICRPHMQSLFYSEKEQMVRTEMYISGHSWIRSCMFSISLVSWHLSGIFIRIKLQLHC